MSDFTITREQLRSLTDPKVKKMFPDAFRNVLEVKKWYKGDLWPAIFCENTKYTGNEFTGYGVKIDDSFYKYLSLFSHYDLQPATQEEVFEALKRAAIKMGYKKGLYCIFGKDKHIRAIESDEFHWNEYLRALIIDGDCIFQDGEWAEIVNKNLL
jgi:hypothetical protein